MTTKRVGTSKPQAVTGQTIVIRAKVSMDWLRSIVDAFFGGSITHEAFQAQMREAWDSIAADGLADEVSALWRVSIYGNR